MLRADPLTRGVPVIARSGGSRGTDARAAGCDEFIAKPFSAQHLADAVRAWLERSGG